MTTASATIDRSALSLGDLTIDGEGDGAYVFDAEGFGAPGITWRESWAEATYVHGSLLTSAVKEQSSLPWAVWVQAGTASVLEDRIDALADALSQFHYTVTVTLNGVARTWTCSPAAFSADSNIRRAEYAELVKEKVLITIPVYPIPGVA